MKILLYENCKVCQGTGTIDYNKMNAGISSTCFNCAGSGRVRKYVQRAEFTSYLLKFKSLGEANKGLQE